ncbi:MAG: hypothetical protein Q8910_00540 [Bacteroidota bacterium]|nr:hypothetical protein [Bacteroidota bacterium]
MEVNKPYVETLEIAGFAAALKAMRLPMKSGDKGDSYTTGVFFPNVDDLGYATQLAYNDGYSNFPEIHIGTKDLDLLQKLIRSGDEHAKAVRGIIVWAEFNMPRYIWSELDTYTIGMTQLSSESTMHCEAKGLSGEELVQFKKDLKEGHMQKRIRAFGYQSLRHIYFQRKNHRLPIWREVIIPWIESLPLAKEFITVNPWWQDKIDELELKVENLQYKLREEQN